MKKVALKTIIALISVTLMFSLTACKKKDNAISSSIMPSSSVPPPNTPSSSSALEASSQSLPEESQQNSAIPSSSSEAQSSSSSSSSKGAIKLKDGTFDGQSQGYNGPVKVLVTVSGGKISKVELMEHTETKDVAKQALEEIPARIVEKNTPKVDIVAGATLSSNAIIRAAEDAIEKSVQQANLASQK